MAYTHFKILKLPVRTILKIKPDVAGSLENAKTDFEYPIAVQQTMTWDSLAFVGNPLDFFTYSLKSDDSPVEWTESIRVTLNNLPETGTPTATVGVLAIPSNFNNQIDDVFVLDSKADRIEVEEQVSGNGINGDLKIKDNLLQFGKTYMLYDFKRVIMDTNIVNPSYPTNHALLKYRLGKIAAGVVDWSAYANITLQREDFAYIYFRDDDHVQNSVDFRRTIFISNGDSNGKVNVAITSPIEMDSFFATHLRLRADTKTNYPFDRTAGAVNYLTVQLNINGMGAFSVQGAPQITFEDPYLFAIDVELISMNDDIMKVDPDNKNLDILVYNDATLLDNFEMIESVTLSEAVDWFERTDDDIEKAYAAPAKIVTAVINKRLGVGSGTYTYEITQVLGDATTITPPGATASNERVITVLDGADTYIYEAKITDTITKAVSIDTFIINLTGDPATTAVPVVINPGNQVLTQNVYYSLQLEFTNPPLILASPTNLPAGIGLSITGLLSGVPTTVETQNTSIVLENSTGPSTPSTDFEMDVIAAVSNPPVITGIDATYGNDNLIYVTEYIYYTYLFTVTNSPTKVRSIYSGGVQSAAITDLGGGNYSASIYLVGNSGQVTITATNASGTDTKVIDVYSDTLTPI